MKLIKTVLLIIMTMVSLVLVVGCGSNTASSISNLEGTYQTKFIDKKDGSKILEVATIKKISNTSYEITIYYFNDARDTSKREPNYTAPQWNGKVRFFEKRQYIATLNKDTLQSNSERATYTITNEGEYPLRNHESIDLSLKKVSDKIQTFEEFSPVPVNELVR